jgi:hypothetical protein
VSYSLYTYCKENPQLNGPKVNYNWSAVLTDDDVPASVKAELKELMSHDFLTLPDYVLFWSDHVQRLRMLDAGKLKRIQGNKAIWCTHNYRIYPTAFSCKFAQLVYSLIQLEPERAAANKYAHYVYSSIFGIEAQRELFCKAPNWTIDKVRYLLHTYCFASKGSSFGDLAMFAPSYLNRWSTLTNEECAALYDWLDESFLATITRSQLQQVKQLLNDCDKPAIKFKSINDVERAHDERTEREVRKLEHKGKIRLSYHPDLEAVVEKYGFILPSSNIAFIKRGKLHNNCVATYFAAHRLKIDLELPVGHTQVVSRIFFTEDATLELGIEYSSDCIVSTRVLQYKGRFNKDATRDKTLIAFRITLVGMPAEVLDVRSIV